MGNRFARHHDQEASSCRGHGRSTRAEKEALTAEAWFWNLFSTEEILSVEAIEDLVKTRHKEPSKQEIIQEAMNWIPEPGTFQNLRQEFFHDDGNILDGECLG